MTKRTKGHECWLGHKYLQISYLQMLPKSFQCAGSWASLDTSRKHCRCSEHLCFISCGMFSMLWHLCEDKLNVSTVTSLVFIHLFFTALNATVRTLPCATLQVTDSSQSTCSVKRAPDHCQKFGSPCRDLHLLNWRQIKRNSTEEAGWGCNKEPSVSLPSGGWHTLSISVCSEALGASLLYCLWHRFRIYSNSLWHLFVSALVCCSE